MLVGTALKVGKLIINILGCYYQIYTFAIIVFSIYRHCKM